jgi:hypothetical protein
MRLFVEAMDAVLVGVDEHGRVQFENEDWKAPTLQEKRAILYAATTALDDLKDLLDILQPDGRP